MEGSERESEVIFESLNLNPQLFINEVLNSVDDLVDEAFNCFQEYSSLFLFFFGAYANRCFDIVFVLFR